MPDAEHGVELATLVALLGAAVIAVPLFRRLGLGSVLGYLAAGVVIGPFGLKVFQEPESVLQVAELGVILLLFVIGLEMKPSRLWSLRRDIFGVGVAQVLVCGVLLFGGALLAGLEPIAAFVAAAGFTLTSTAIVLQILDERGETNTPPGQKIVSILLLEDLAIIPLLGVIAFLAPETSETSVPIWVRALTGIAAIAGLVFAGRYVLTPLFRILAATKAREIMTAAALLVVLGAAMALEAGGLSMALGAFVAGVVLSESSFRHQLEADIEPFRGLLLGLFFLAVGMSLDLGVVGSDWLLIIGAVIGMMSIKAAGIYTLARLLRTGHRDALQRALLMAQGGEFAFVLYATAGDAHLFDAQTLAILLAAVIISMALTPLAPLSFRWLLPAQPQSLEGVAAPENLSGTALIIGFGRFGQVVSQALLARAIDVTIIDVNANQIRNAAAFGFKIYYGDGTRIDVMRAAGAGTAKIICICIDRREDTNQIVDLAAAEFPLAKLFVRSFDRGHSLHLRSQPIEFEIRETVESAFRLGEESLIGLGFSPEEAAATTAEVRRRDIERLRLQQLEGRLSAGRDLVFRQPVPTPLTPVRKESQALSAETAVVAGDAQKPVVPAEAQSTDS